jgi:hypothetical protein
VSLEWAYGRTYYFPYEKKINPKNHVIRHDVLQCQWENRPSDYRYFGPSDYRYFGPSDYRYFGPLFIRTNDISKQLNFPNIQRFSYNAFEWTEYNKFKINPFPPKMSSFFTLFLRICLIFEKNVNNWKHY